MGRAADTGINWQPASKGRLPLSALLVAAVAALVALTAFYDPEKESVATPSAGAVGADQPSPKRARIMREVERYSTAPREAPSPRQAVAPRRSPAPRG